MIKEMNQSVLWSIKHVLLNKGDVCGHVTINISVWELGAPTKQPSMRVGH